MAGSRPRVFKLDRTTALELARILNNLTVARIGSTVDYEYVAYVARTIEDAFPNQVERGVRYNGSVDPATGELSTNVRSH